MAAKRQGSVQIRQIAEALGVSVGTVSIVLNGRGDVMRISKETQKRVRDMAKEMNYQPNIYARRLRSAAHEKAGRVIAVLWNSAYSDLMMGQFFRGLHEYQKKHDCKMEFYVQMFENDKLNEMQALLTPLRFSAVIICGISDQDSEFLNNTQFDLPILVLFRSEERYHCIYGDDCAVGGSIARLLANHGHKKVSLIGCSRKGRSGSMRMMGFLEACEREGLRIKPQWHIEKQERNCGAGYAAMQEILRQEERPTAIFSASNEQALGIVIACREAEVRIPEDMELIVYGDNDAFAYFSPSISAVYLSLEKVAEASAELLEMVMNNAITLPMARIMQAEYVFRDSCAGFAD